SSRRRHTRSDRDWSSDVCSSDLDPAGVVYTPRFGDYVVEAAHDFMACMIGTPLQAQLAALDFGTPAKSLQFVFHRSLYPDDEFRSEERRVGKECRSRGVQAQYIE